MGMFSKSEMEFLDIKVDFKEKPLLSGFKDPHKKIRETRKLDPIYGIVFCRTEKWGSKTKQKLESEKTWVYA